MSGVIPVLKAQLEPRSSLSHPMSTLEAQCVFRLMLHMEGAQIIAASTLRQDVEFLLSRASASLGVAHNVAVMRVLETLALVVSDS